MPPTLPEVYIHPNPSTILPYLLPLLPAPLPLVRRLQFRHQSPSAYILSTLPPCPAATTTPSSPSSPPPPPPPPFFAAAYLDRSFAPETECWLFSSAETSTSPQPATPGAGPAAATHTHTHTHTHQLHLVALLRTVATLPLPPAFPPFLSPTTLCTGAVHATTLALLLSARVSPRDGPDALPPLAVDALHNPVPPRPPHRLARAGAGRAHAAGLAWGHGVAYGKFLFAPGAFGEATGADPPPPRGLRWAEVAGRDLETVVRAMETPRRVGTVGLLAGVGLRAEEAAEGAAEGAELVAWGFLSVDGSLASLYTDPQLRGRGMGKAVGKRLGRMVQAGDGARMDGERDEAGMAFRGVRPGGDWVHADVMAANIGSVKVMEGLGGVWAWDCHWCWLDLELVDRVSWGDEESSSAIEMQKGEQLR